MQGKCYVSRIVLLALISKTDTVGRKPISVLGESCDRKQSSSSPIEIVHMPRPSLLYRGRARPRISHSDFNPPMAED